jgi:hypothetical protein
MSSAVYDDVSGKWKLTACVSWQGTDNEDRFHFLKELARAILTLPGRRKRRIGNRKTLVREKGQANRYELTRVSHTCFCDLFRVELPRRMN